MDWSNEYFKKVKIIFDRFERLPRRQKIAVVILVFIAVISCAIFAVAELGGYGQNGPATSPNTLDLGLAGYWDMEEGGGQTVKDKSGNGNDGTLGSSSSADPADPVFVSGHDSSGENGMGLNFDGADKHVRITDSPTLDVSTQMSAFVWVKGDSQPGYRPVIGQYDVPAAKRSWAIGAYGTSNEYLDILLSDDGTAPSTGHGKEYRSSNVIFDNEWHYVGFIFNAGSLKLYVDGQEIPATKISDGAITTIYNPALDMTIGCRLSNDSPVDFFNGSVDEARVYNRALSDDEIRLLYNQKKPILEMKLDEGSGTVAHDESFNHYDGTITGATWAEGKNGGALSFDGTDDHVITTKKVDKPSVYTISLWLDGDRSQGSGGLVVGYGGSYGRWGFYLEGSGSTIVSRNTNDITSDNWSIESYNATNYPAGWHFVTLTDDGTTRKFYRDGVFIGQHTNSIANSGMDQFISVGQGGGTWASYFQGSLDDARIYNYVRTTDEILADYNDGMAAHFGKNNQDLNRGLAGYWDMEEGGGQTVKDKSGNGNDGTLGSSSSADPADPIFVPGHDSAGENGTGLKFDGSDDYASTGSSSLLELQQQTFSVWIKASDFNQYKGIMETTYGSGKSTKSRLMTFGGNTVRYHPSVGDDISAYVEFTNLPVDTWINLTATWDGSVAKGYLNGVNVGSVSFSTPITYASTPKMAIGVDQASSDRFFSGSIDEARVYNRALSEDEIRQLYNQKKPVFEMKFDEGSGTAAHDESFNNNDGTISGAAWTAGKSGTALAFDSTSDYMAASGNNVNPTDAMTISVWVKGDPQFSNLVKKTDGTNGFILSAYKWSGSEDHGIKFTVYNGGVNNQSWSSRKTGYSSDWKNLTVTWTNGTVSFFYNGQALGTSTNTITQIGVASANIVVGGGFIGSVDDVRIYNYVRTADEILVDYNYGMAVRLGKNNQDLNYGLVGHWDMEEGGGQIIYDKSGNGNNGTLGSSSSADSADPVFVSGHDSAGENGTGVSFDGRDDRISVADQSSLKPEEITIGLWFNASSWSNGKSALPLVSKRASSYDGYFLFYYANTSSITFDFAGGSYRWNTGYNPPLNEWIHLVVTRSATERKLYVNGQEYSSTAVAGSLVDSTGSLGIGYDPMNSYSFLGSIDEARVYNRALSEDEIRQLYNQKKPVFEMKFDEGSGTAAHDESFNNNDGTISGAAWTAGKSGTALSFDGTDDYVQVSHSAILEPGSVSVSAWVKLNSDGNRHIVAAKWTGYSLEVNPSGYPYFQISTGSGTVVAYSPKQMQFGVWQHLSGTFNNDTKELKIFINGSEEESVTSPGSIVYGHNVMRMSNNLYSDGAVNGSIDNFCIYSYARTAGEVLVDYNNGLAAHLR